MVFAWCCCTTYFACYVGILERHIFRKMNWKMWTNNRACSFPWFKSLRFLCLGASKFYSLWYRTQWPPGLPNTHKERTWDDPCDTWNFPANQGKRCSDLQPVALKVKFDILLIFVKLQEAVSRKTCLGKSMLLGHLFLFRGVDPPSAGLTMHYSFTLYKGAVNK